MENFKMAPRTLSTENVPERELRDFKKNVSNVIRSELVRAIGVERAEDLYYLVVAIRDCLVFYARGEGNAIPYQNLKMLHTSTQLYTNVSDFLDKYDLKLSDEITIDEAILRVREKLGDQFLVLTDFRRSKIVVIQLTDNTDA